MTININNVPKEITSSSLTELLQQLHITTNGIAIAINNKVVSKTNWDATQIQENDSITIIQATQGG